MLPLERISGLAVIKFLRLPFDEREIQTVVLRVTASAFLAGLPLGCRTHASHDGRLSRTRFLMAVEQRSAASPPPNLWQVVH